MKKSILFIIIIAAVTGLICGIYVLCRKKRPSKPFVPKTPEEMLDCANQLANHQEYQSAGQMYNNLIKQKRAGPDVYYYLAELNYARARDDKDPVLVQACNLYKQAILSGYIDCMVKLADIYNFCNVKGTDIPSKEVARALYNKVIRHSKTSQEAKVTANLRLVDLNREFSLANMNKLARVLRHLPDDQVLREHNVPNGPAYNVRPQPIPQRNIPLVIRNDSQNVHDRQIQQAFSNSVQKLKKLNGYDPHAIPQREIIQQITEYIRTCPDLSQDMKTRALKTVDVMNKTNATIAAPAGGIREGEILGLVWNRIHAKENNNNRDNLKEAFAHELADATVGEGPVCATGRVTRVINALEGTDVRDDIVRFRPKWALKEEIQGKAARVRDEIIQRATDEERQAYETDGKDGVRAQNLAQTVTERMKKELLKRCTEEYVNQNLLTKDELNNELTTVAEAL